MYGAMIGSAIGGCVAGLLKTAIYAFAGASSVIALPLFVSADKPNNLLFMVISVLVGAVATFAATWVLYSPKLPTSNFPRKDAFAVLQRLSGAVPPPPTRSRAAGRRAERAPARRICFLPDAYLSPSDHT